MPHMQGIVLSTLVHAVIASHLPCCKFLLSYCGSSKVYGWCTRLGRVRNINALGPPSRADIICRHLEAVNNHYMLTQTQEETGRGDVVPELSYHRLLVATLPPAVIVWDANPHERRKQELWWGNDSVSRHLSSPNVSRNAHGIYWVDEE